MKFPGFESMFTNAGEVATYPSYDKDLKPIGVGKKTTRFSIKSHPDERFLVAGKMINYWNPFDQIFRLLSNLLGYTVEIKTSKGEAILLNINSLASRLHVDKKEIKDAAASGVFEQFLYDIAKPERIEQISKQVIQKIYSDVMELFDVINNQLVYKNDGVQTGLTPKDLLDGIEEAFASKRKSVDQQKKSFKFWRNEKGQPTYLVKKLGGGSYSKVYVIFDFVNGTAGAFKDALRKGKVLARSRIDVINEYTLLNLIHEKGRAWGIQAKPQKCGPVTVQTKKGPESPIKERFGYIGLKYDGDYFDDIVGTDKNPKNPKLVSAEDRLLEFHQLLSGLKRLTDLNILHGDIKPENIFIKQTGSIKYVHIADLGGACHVDKDGPLVNLIAGGGKRAASPNYLMYSDLEECLALAKDGNRKGVIEVEKKRDVFSMGTVFHTALTGSLPYDTDKYGFPISTTYTPIDRPDVPTELKSLIQSMTATNINDRPSAAAAFATLEEIIKKSYPAVYNKIQNEMAKDFIV